MRVAVIIAWAACVSGGSFVQAQKTALHLLKSSRVIADKSEFQRQSMGELDRGGIALGFTTFTAPDGFKVTVFYLTHEDPNQAARAFKQELARAFKIVRQTKKRNGSGKVVGDRAEIVVPGG